MGWGNSLIKIVLQNPVDDAGEGLQLGPTSPGGHLVPRE